MHGHCHVWPWLMEFSSVTLSCFTLSCWTIFLGVSLINMEDHFNPLFDTILYVMSWVRKLVNTHTHIYILHQRVHPDINVMVGRAFKNNIWAMRNQEMEPMNVYGADYNHPLPNLLILTYKPFTPFADYNWSVYIYIYVSLLLLVSVSPLLLISIKALKINTLQYTKKKNLY